MTTKNCTTCGWFVPGTLCGVCTLQSAKFPTPMPCAETCRCQFHTDDVPINYARRGILDRVGAALRRLIP